MIALPFRPPIEDTMMIAPSLRSRMPGAATMPISQ